jgi:hypothetical protein
MIILHIRLFVVFIENISMDGGRKNGLHCTYTKK